MGGGDNELIIKTILDTTGFAKGSKQLLSAMKGLTNSIKSLFGRVVGVASVFGILSKAVSTFMSQNQLLTKQMNAAWTALGNALGPIITQLITWVTQAVSYLVTLMKLLGFTSKTASQASKAAQGAAGSLQRTVAGFDELNKLSDGGGSGQGTLQDVNPEDWMKSLTEALKKKAWDDAADIIVGKFNELIDKAKSKSEELGQKIGEYLQGALRIGARIIKDVDWSGIGETIANFFNGILSKVEGKDLGTILVGKFVVALGVLTGFLETLDLGAVATFLSDTIIGAFESIGEAIEKADWQKIGQNIRTFFENIKWEEIATAIFEALKSAWNAAIDLLWGLLGQDTKEEPPLIASLRSLGESIEKFVDAVKPILESFWNDVLSPVINWAVNTALPDFFEALADRIGDLADLLSGKMNFGEFLTNMTSLETLLGMIGIAVGGISFAGFIDGIITLSSTSVLGKLIEVLAITLSGTGTLAEAFDLVFVKGSENAGKKVGLLKIIVDNLTTSITLAVVALAFLYAKEVISAQEAQYLDEAFEGLGNSSEDLAVGVARLTEEVQKTQEEYDNLAACGGDLTMVQEELDVRNNVLREGMKILADSLGITTDELKAQIEAAGGDVTQIEALKNAHDQLIESNRGVAESAGEATDAVAASTQGFDDSANAADNTADRYQDAARRLIENYENVASSNQENMAAVEQYTSEHIGGAADAAVSQTGEMETVTTESFDTMRDTILTDMQDIDQIIVDVWNNVISNTSQAVAEVQNVAVSGFNELISAAYSWGQDLLYNFVNGLAAAAPYFKENMAAVAQIIRNYLGFSEPKEGPLHDFHTYAPDMMELYASGIEKNKGEVLSAVNDVAESVADEFGASPLSMSSVASGGIVPYGVSGAGGSSSGSSADLGIVMDELRTLVQEFKYTVENMEFVAQFGDLKAVAKQITTIQKQMERAGG